jgi:hypothetical protein
MAASEPSSDISEEDEPRFIIDRQINRQYSRFNSVRRQLRVRLLPPREGEDTNPMSHFVTSVTDLFE